MDPSITNPPRFVKRKIVEGEEEEWAEKSEALKRFKEENDQLKKERREEIQRNTERKAKLRAERAERADNALAAEEEESNVIEAEDPESEQWGRKWTLSIAVPASLLNNATSLEMKTLLSGQIARAATVFCVDEIVIFDDGETGSNIEKPYIEKNATTKQNMLLMARILQYLECPPYLRKYFFPVHDDLKFVGLLSPLEAPHHLRKDEVCLYREGVVLKKDGASKRDMSFVNVGLRSNALVYGALEPQQRVTVRFRSVEKQGILNGDPVHFHMPRTEGGWYWGYDVRLAHSFNAIFTKSPHEDGYDLTVGISQNGENAEKAQIPSFQHAIIVIGGVRSIEKTLENDDKLEVKDPADLFDMYLNTCPALQSSVIRAEESLMVSLSVLGPKIQAAANT